MNITVGTRVRSFDFAPYNKEVKGERACFMEGEVVGFKELQGCQRLIIEVDRCVFGGKERSDFPSQIFPPVNDTATLFGGTTNNVEIIHRIRSKQQKS